LFYVLCGCVGRSQFDMFLCGGCSGLEFMVYRYRSSINLWRDLVIYKNEIKIASSSQIIHTIIKYYSIM